MKQSLPPTNDGRERGKQAEHLPSSQVVTPDLGQPAPAPDQSVPTPTLGEATAVWARIGFLSFGGPAGQIALIHREVVEDRRWLDEKTFLSALNFCMLLPGPEAMQLATFAGWRLHGVIGGVIAGLLFVLPGAFLVGTLSVLYALYGTLPISQALFLGVKAAVLAIVFQALIKVSRRALTVPAAYLMAVLAFLALFVFQLPFPLIVIAAATIGAFAIPVDPSSLSDGHKLDAGLDRVMLKAAGRTAILWLVIWIVPLAAFVAVTGGVQVFADLALFFSKLAIVTFGGAYAVLSYMAQEAVQGFGWLKPGEMVDGLGLAETTPGPLILVTQFVGFLAAFRTGGEQPSLIYGVLGMVVTLWATFAPCFLWIFTGAPFISRLENMPRLRAALAGVTAAVVGVIANLSVWFAFNVLFNGFHTVNIAGGTMRLPDLGSFHLEAFGLAVVGFVALLWFRFGVLTTLSICAAGGLLVSAVAS
ncbi:MAG: chromate efflux transporter [Pseudomonadota bacterium]